MNSDQLRALQAPLKQSYRENPDSAVATLVAVGSVNIEQVSCEIQRSSTQKPSAGLHPMTGGDGTHACAAEILLESVVACAGVTFGAVCSAMEIPIDAAEVRAEATLDFRGTLGVTRDVPVGFKTIRLLFTLASDETDEKLAKAVQLAERYCVVAQTVKAVTSEWQRSPRLD